MAMSRRVSQRQGDLWVASTEIVQGPGHPFYRKLNQVLAEAGFDEFVEQRCASFYAPTMGRPSVVPGVYFRMLLIGYLEGIDSERGIAWRCADSLGLRTFLGYTVTEPTPDHSTLSVIRQRIDLGTHEEVFTWVLKVLSEKGLLRGKTVGVDATTLEANAAMRSIVRRDTGQSYQDFLTQLAKASGIETPTREDLAKVDRHRKGKGSNEDWYNPNDPEAKITKMKDGRTHLAHKAEHAVDLQTGAIVAVTIQQADQGDTSTLLVTVDEAESNLEAVQEQTQAGSRLSEGGVEEVVADKGYHSNETMTELKGREIRSYVSEPRRGRRCWQDQGEEQAAVYANRRRIRGDRGKRLMRRRGELVERPFAHCYETGGMRRVHLRGHTNILKRLLIHVAGFNLALVMRSMFGLGKPRRLQGGLLHVLAAIWGPVFRRWRVRTAFWRSMWPSTEFIPCRLVA
jgi:transposase